MDKLELVFNNEVLPFVVEVPKDQNDKAENYAMLAKYLWDHKGDMLVAHVSCNGVVYATLVIENSKWIALTYVPVEYGAPREGARILFQGEIPA